MRIVVRCSTKVPRKIAGLTVLFALKRVLPGANLLPRSAPNQALQRTGQLARSAPAVPSAELER